MVCSVFQMSVSCCLCFVADWDLMFDRFVLGVFCRCVLCGCVCLVLWLFLCCWFLDGWFGRCVCVWVEVWW